MIKQSRQVVFATLFTTLFVGAWTGRADLNSNLVAYYPFNGNANDESGNGNHGVVYGATLTTDRFGNANRAYYFDGEDDYIAFPEAVFGPSVNAFTFSAWVQTRNEDYTALKEIIYKGSYNGEAALAAGSNIFGFSVKLSDGQWYGVDAPMIKNANVHLVGVYRKGNQIELWINGTLSGYLTVPFLDLFTYDRYHFSSIGAYSQGMYRNINEGFYWNSVIDEVRIYSRALSASEVQQLYLLSAGAAPLVSNVHASQQSGTKLVNVTYDVADGDSATLSVTVAVSTNGGASYTLPATSFSGNGYGPNVTPGNNKRIVWNAGADWNGKFSANVRFRVTARDGTIHNAIIYCGCMSRLLWLRHATFNAVIAGA